MRPNWRNGGKASQPAQPSTDLVASPVVQPSKSMQHNPKDSTSIIFLDVCLEFSSALSEVWPLEEEFKKQSDDLKQSTDKKVETGFKLAKAFQNEFKDLFPLVLKKDPAFFSSPKLSSVNAYQKYASSPASVRETVWEYLKSMVQYARMADMYGRCPQGMLDSISGIAGGLIDKLQSGEMSMNNLNPLQLGQMMMTQMNQNDLQQFGEAIMESGNIESMMSLMQSSMGVPGMAELTKMMPGMDRPSN